MSAENTAIEKEARRMPNIKQEIGFLGVHFIPILGFWTGATTFDWIVCVSLYFLRMFFITGFYHRYFSHKTYKTSRWFQFVMAFSAQTSMQKGALWWSAHHRVHHRTSDTPKDPHSMKVYGFWYSHIGWILGPDYKETDFKGISDFAKFPELVWINKYHLIPPLSMALAVWMTGSVVNGGSLAAMFTTAGLSSLVIGYFLSTVILFHGTFSINSIMHKIGRQRYETGDESRNSAILAFVTLGEGWHNNHHYYESSTRQGFYWWEFDITFYLIKLLSFVGLVWDIQGVPKHIKYSKNKKEAYKLKKEYDLEKKSA